MAVYTILRTEARKSGKEPEGDFTYRYGGVKISLPVSRIIQGLREVCQGGRTHQLRLLQKHPPRVLPEKQKQREFVTGRNALYEMLKGNSPERVMMGGGRALKICVKKRELKLKFLLLIYLTDNGLFRC